ncbi:MAG TPA: TIGR03086 family metal-binding protein [Actinocrinis sp.]|uniref:TIGR03086 family metal-binding protein n=1 Tax=Actinocrinis sp. TaxID=1920516 RepID=UPI002DDD3AFB|nr:TIGR03086 family metal-binding protein [Actinocrinis sp.]HEV2343411.1 TIGR03086 family metal-binding protein [Actinocrinis sp.]
MADIRELSRRTLETTVSIVAGLKPDQLGSPTPCSEWDLRALLAHMIGQHYGFAAAARGEEKDRTVWDDRPIGDDPAAQYAQAVHEVTTAFREEGLLGRRFWLPEIHETVRFPAPTAISFHLLDYVVHGWDVARSLGVVARFDDDLVAAALAVGEQIPEGESRLEPGAQFRPTVAVTDDASPMDRLIAMTGRSPSWPD